MARGLPEGYERIAADLKRTTGHVLELAEEPEFGGATITIDGEVLGSFARSHSSDRSEHLAEFVDALQEQTLDEYVWGGWPTCPRHHTHPLKAEARDADAVWVCPASDVVIAAVGSLTELG